MNADDIEIKNKKQQFENSFDEAFEELLKNVSSMKESKVELDNIEAKIKQYEKERDAKIIECTNKAVDIAYSKEALREIVDLLKKNEKTSKINLSSAPRIV